MLIFFGIIILVTIILFLWFLIVSGNLAIVLTAVSLYILAGITNLIARKHPWIAGVVCVVGFILLLSILVATGHPVIAGVTVAIVIVLFFVHTPPSPEDCIDGGCF